VTSSVSAVEDDTEEFELSVNYPDISEAAGVVKVFEDEFALDLEETATLKGLSPVFKRKLARRKAGSKRIETDTETGYNAFEVVAPPYNMDYLAALYEMSGYHRGAVDARCTNTVGLGYDLIESDRALQAMEALENEESIKRARRKKARLKSDVKDWLDDISQDEDLTVVLKNMYTDYLTTGNGYLEIGRTVGGEISYIGHIPASTVRVRTKRDGFVQIVGRRAVFFANFQSGNPDPIGGDTNPNEVIHFKNYSPTGNYYGVPEIVSAKTAVAGNEFSSRYNLDYFEHKAAPRYVIVTKNAKWSDGALKELMEFLEGNVKGKNHRTVVIPLSSEAIDKKIDFEMKPVETGVQEGSFKSYRADNRDEILMTQRTPINKLGLPNGIALAAARDADKMFKEQVCGPEQNIVQKKISKIIGERTDVFKFKLVELTLTDEKTQADIDKIYATIQESTPNEIRNRKGKTPIEGGDKVLPLTGQIQAENAAQVGQTRERDSQRATRATDSSGEGRNAKGDGRTTP